MMEKIILVDMDNVLCDFDKAHKQAILKTSGIKFPQSQYKFFENLEKIENSIESVNLLKTKYKVYILTRPSIQNPLCYTENRNWIEKHLGLDMLNNLIISCDKTMVKGDYLIDDNIQKGIFKPEWKLLKFGTSEYPDWNSIIKKLM